MKQPNIETQRLILRPFCHNDAERVAVLAGEKIISDMTASIPHPYESSMAIDWINTHKSQYEQRTAVVYAITMKDDSRIIGAVSFPQFKNGEGTIGYWLGVPFWGQGIAYEAAKGLIAHCKANLGLKTVHAVHLTENVRSQSVIEKLRIPLVGNETHEVRGGMCPVRVYRGPV
ncbi:GNAT family N-acetyltransferase [Pseudoalteromonas sp. SMS1]|uniref:GNAT family N-acetyltransferase n=1 Tax=Pseudoalteromonas sp. SMS1 TaxID=2908894 RepID=UPI001F336690|nr:GNAT family N-acetyltransferase [Pseudoalteromonas sp. SMS1]MCF2856979.1 GNAT family N-acetyltransferase [Pseudoalteromonas sp. SMS1]